MVMIKPRPLQPLSLLTATAKCSSILQQQQQQAAAEVRIAALEANIEADPYDVVAWDGRLGEAVREGSPEPVFERAIKIFPTAARIWTAYAEWWESQDITQSLSIYQRCLQQVPSLDLWSSYLTFCKRHRPVEEVLRAYQQATDLLGTDWRAGVLWSEYIALLKRVYNLLQKKENPEAEVCGKLLSEDPNPIEAARRAMKPLLRKKAEENKPPDISDEELTRVGEALRIDACFLRAAFQKAVSSAHAAVDKLWVGYEQFEKSLGNPQLASKLLGEHMPRCLRGKSSFKEIQSLCTGLDPFAVAVPLRPHNVAQQTKMLERWRNLIQFERANPLRLSRPDLQVRVIPAEPWLLLKKQSFFSKI